MKGLICVLIFVFIVEIGVVIWRDRHRLIRKFFAKRMKKLLTCTECGKGGLTNKYGYLKCENCGYEYR